MQDSAFVRILPLLATPFVSYTPCAIEHADESYCACFVHVQWRRELEDANRRTGCFGIKGVE